MAISIVIDGVEVGTAGIARRYRLGTLEIEKRWTVEQARMTLLDRDDLTASAYRPALGDPITITQDGGVFLFGGWITAVEDSRAGEHDDVATVTTIEARGHEVLATEVYTGAEVFAPSTLLAVGSALVTKYLSPKGITWTGPTSGGPATGEIRLEKQRLDESLTQLTVAYGWPWRITGQGNAFFQDPTAIGPAPNSPLSAANCRVIRSSTWRAEQLLQHTRVLLQTGGSGEITYTHPTYTGDGVATTFLLLVEPSVIPTQVIEGGTPVPIDGVTWSYNEVDHAIIKSSPVANGVTVRPADFVVELPAWIRVGGPFLPSGALDRAQVRETIIQASEITDVTQALVYAVGVLDRRVVPEQIASLQTYTTNWFPIQRADLDFPARLLTGAFIVQGVVIRDEGLADEPAGLLYELEVASGTLARRDWTEYWRERKASSGGGTALIGAPPPISGTDPPGAVAPRIVYLGGSRVAASTGDGSRFWPPGLALMRLDGTHYPSGAWLVVGARLALAGGSFQVALRNTDTASDAGTTPAYSSTGIVEQLVLLSLPNVPQLYRPEIIPSGPNVSCLIEYAYVMPF